MGRPPDARIRTFGVTSASSANDASVAPDGKHVPDAGLVEGGAAHDRGRAADGGGVHARAVGDRFESIGAPAPHVLHARVVDRVGGDRHVVVAGRHDRADLQIRRGDRLAVDEEAPGTVAVGAADEPSVGEEAGRARHQLDPGVVVIDEQHRRLAGRGVDRDHLDRSLVA